MLLISRPECERSTTFSNCFNSMLPLIDFFKHELFSENKLLFFFRFGIRLTTRYRYDSETLDPKHQNATYYTKWSININYTLKIHSK